MRPVERHSADTSDLLGLYEMLVDFASYSPTDEIRSWYLRCANTIDAIIKIRSMKNNERN